MNKIFLKYIEEKQKNNFEMTSFKNSLRKNSFQNTLSLVENINPPKLKYNPVTYNPSGEVNLNSSKLFGVDTPFVDTTNLNPDMRVKNPTIDLEMDLQTQETPEARQRRLDTNRELYSNEHQKEIDRVEAEKRQAEERARQEKAQAEERARVEAENARKQAQRWERAADGTWKEATGASSPSSSASSGQAKPVEKMPSGIPSVKDVGKMGIGFGFGLGGWGTYDQLTPESVRDYLSDKEVNIGKTKLNADELAQITAFEMGAAVPQMFGQGVVAPLANIPGNVIGGSIGYQKGAEIGKNYAERLGLGETGKTVSEYGAGILGYGGGASVANSLLRFKNPAAKTILGKSLGIAGAGLGLADTGMEEWEKGKAGKFEGWGKEASNILDPGDLLYLAAGPVIGPAALVGSKAFKLGSAITRSYQDERQKKTSAASQKLTDATLKLNDDEFWKDYTPESREQYRKFVSNLETEWNKDPRLISSERAAVNAASKESMKDLKPVKDKEGTIVGYKSSTADRLKKEAEDAARKRGFKTAAEIDAEQAQQIAALKKQASKREEQNEEIKVQRKIKNLLEQFSIN